MTLQSYPSRRLGLLQFDFIQRLEGQGKSINTVKNYRTDLDCYADYLTKFQKSDDLSKVDLFYSRVRKVSATKIHQR